MHRDELTKLLGVESLESKLLLKLMFRTEFHCVTSVRYTTRGETAKFFHGMLSPSKTSRCFEHRFDIRPKCLAYKRSTQLQSAPVGSSQLQSGCLLSLQENIVRWNSLVVFREKVFPEFSSHHQEHSPFT